MKKQHQLSLTSLFLLLFSLSACSEKEMNNLELRIIGTWDKDWNESIMFVESKPELEDYLFGLKMVSKLQGNNRYNFKKDRTFVLNLGQENLAREKSVGYWSVSKDSILRIETTKSTSSGVFSDRKSYDAEAALTYKIKSINSKRKGSIHQY